jgi:hypothetical protein
MVILDYRHLQRALRILAPVGQQLVERARIDHRARQYVRAHLRAFFQHAHRDIGGKLL